MVVQRDCLSTSCAPVSALAGLLTGTRHVITSIQDSSDVFRLLIGGVGSQNAEKAPKALQ